MDTTTGPEIHFGGSHLFVQSFSINRRVVATSNNWEGPEKQGLHHVMPRGHETVLTYTQGENGSLWFTDGDYGRRLTRGLHTGLMFSCFVILRGGEQKFLQFVLKADTCGNRPGWIREERAPRTETRT